MIKLSPVLFIAGALLGGAIFSKGEDGLVPDEVILLVGQSNMAGRAPIGEEDKGEIEGTLLWNVSEGKWEPAVAPLNRYSKHRKNLGMQQLNPGVGFAKGFRVGGKKLGIVCSARGGTSIEEWEKGKPLYDASVEAAKSALERGGRLVGILWHQGESNSKRPAGYPEKLAALVGNFRTDFETEDLPFVFGELGRWGEKYAAFNAMIVEQVEKIPNSACASTEGLSSFDGAHFDAPSQRTLGDRYAKALASLLGKDR